MQTVPQSYSLDNLQAADDALEQQREREAAQARRSANANDVPRTSAAWQILDLAERENRPLTETEGIRVSLILHEEQRAEWHERFAYEDQRENARAAEARQDRPQRPRLRTGNRYRTHDGKVIKALAPHERFSNDHDADPPCFGRWARAVLLGDWRGAEKEREIDAKFRAASDTQTPGSAGVLVPVPLLERVWDLARAQSQLIAAGSETIPMTSKTLTLTRAETDVTFETKAENQAFTPSDPTFQAVVLDSHTVGAFSLASMELVADSPTFGMALTTSMSRGLAAEVDRLGLNGVGTTEPLGILPDPATPNTTLTGPITWDAMSNAATAVRVQNYEPSAFILSPTNEEALSLTQASTAGTWLGAPPSIEMVPRLQSTNIADTSVITGDFTQNILGMRVGATLEMTSTGGSTFANYQAAWRIVTRIDWQRIRPTAFLEVDGIT